MTTELPAAPLAGESDVIAGAGDTVNVTPLLFNPPAVTTTEPVVAPTGTGTRMFVSLQLIGVATVPLNVMVLVPCGEPNPDPVMLIVVFAGPEFGDRLLMFGAAVRVKVTPALDWPPTVTTTGPVVAPVGTGATILVLLQLVGVAAVLLNLTVLLPWLAPKFDPVIVIDVPARPESGARLLTTGTGELGTVKATPLLAIPPTVTITFPLVAVDGTLN